MEKFGELLRNFRQRCKDADHPEHGLSQDRFGQLVGAELGIDGYSGAAVSDWERGKSKIHADQRKVLISLIKVLHRQNGIRTLSEANQLLNTGNYRDLDVDEAQQIFSGAPGSEQAVSEIKDPGHSYHLF